MVNASVGRAAAPARSPTSSVSTVRWQESGDNYLTAVRFERKVLIVTTTQNTSLARYLADAPGRGFSVAQKSSTVYVLTDAYGDGSTDETITVTHENGIDVFQVVVG